MTGIAWNHYTHDFAPSSSSTGESNLKGNSLRGESVLNLLTNPWLAVAKVISFRYVICSSHVMYSLILNPGLGISGVSRDTGHV